VKRIALRSSQREWPKRGIGGREGGKGKKDQKEKIHAGRAKEFSYCSEKYFG
jgi:hypothetical protein